MVISNSGEEDDRLLQVQTDLAHGVELHVTEMKNEVMTMRPVEGIDIPAGGAAELKPGGYHVMLINLQPEIKPGEKYPLTLVFERGGALVVEAEVRAPYSFVRDSNLTCNQADRNRFISCWGVRQPASGNNCKT